ncbi:MAG: zeta toxin family protein [bacterium]|nr:zeta toxin family protein [bacterium]
MQTLSQEEQNISDAALRYIQSNEKLLITLFANADHFIEEPQAVTLFMAGAPGAGKTEVSKNLVEDDLFTNKPVRIDADEIRKLVPGYSGEFTHLYQHAATCGVDILFSKRKP